MNYVSNIDFKGGSYCDLSLEGRLVTLATLTVATVGAGHQLGPVRATVRAAPKLATPTVKGGGVLLVLFSRSVS